MTTGTPNLHQRLLLAISQIDRVKATGKTAQGVKTMSIADVEGAIKKALAENGIITRPSHHEKPIWNPEAKPAVWEVDLIIRVVNADDPNDFYEDRTCDVGSNPSAAVSWAVKRYWKAVFHLSDDDERAGQSYEPAIPGARRSSYGDSPRQAPPRSEPPVAAVSSGSAARIASLHNSLPANMQWTPAVLKAKLGHPDPASVISELEQLHARSARPAVVEPMQEAML